MAKNIFVGVNGVARKPKAIYVGVNGVARRVKSVYVGVNGVAKQVYPGGVVPNNYTQFAYIDGRCGFIYADVNPLSYPRVVIDFSVFDDHAYGGTLVDTYYYHNDYNSDTGENWETAWILLYYASYFMTSYMGNCFNFFYSAEQIDPNTGYFPDESNYYTEFKSNASEGVLKNTRYKLDFLNGNGVYLYNSEGYYSIASHNLVGNISSKASITNQYGSPYNSYQNGIRLFGNDGVIYGAKMYNGNTLIRDYYPCYRNSDHYMGYYDSVNKIFYKCRSGTPDRERDFTYEQAIQNNYYIGPIV